MTRDAAGYYCAYDYENRITQVKDTSNTNIIVKYAYDALGRRIEKVDYTAGSPTATTRYYYDGWRVVCEADGGGTWKRDYVYGNYIDEVLMKREDTAATDDLYYAHDHLFSPVALIESDGDVVERCEYDAYGKCNIMDAAYGARSASNYNNVIAFTGQRLDRMNGNALDLMYYKNRYYVVDLARFASRDPLGINDSMYLFEFTPSGGPKFPRQFKAQQEYQDGMNLYEYVKSNSLGAFDFLGLETKSACETWRCRTEKDAGDCVLCCAEIYTKKVPKRSNPFKWPAWYCWYNACMAACQESNGKQGPDNPRP